MLATHTLFIMTLIHTLTAIPLVYIAYSLVALLFALLAWVIYLEIRIRQFTRGKSGKSLEETILHMRDGQHELERFRAEVESYLRDVEQRLTRSVRDVKTIRFNPFKGSGMGGNQSFATALLNEDGDGVILSSLYARDHVSMFAKPITHYRSEHELTEEERAVLSEARHSLSKK